MIDIGKILGRAWHVLRNYKVLWIFGILVVLMGGGGGRIGPNVNGSWNGGSHGGGDGYQGGYTYTPENLPAFIERTNEWFDTYAQPWFEENVEPWFETPEGIVSFIIWAVVILLALGILFWLLTSLIRYPSETAIMRMVDEYERSGEKAGFKQGWRLGWSRRAFRLWAIDAIIGLPGFVLTLAVLGLGLALAASAIRGTWGAWGAVWGTIFAVVIGIALLGGAIALLSLFLGLLRPFLARKATLEGTGVGDSFRQGWTMFWGNWQSAGLMWLVMIGLAIGFALLSLLAFIALIPVLIVTFAAGLLVASIPFGLVLWIGSLTSIAPIAWMFAVIAAMPFLLMVTFSPFILIGSGVEVFTSSVWTLTYREIKALETIKPASAAKAAKA